MITFDLNWSNYISQKNQLGNDYMFGNAVFVHFFLNFYLFLGISDPVIGVKLLWVPYFL